MSVIDHILETLDGPWLVAIDGNGRPCAGDVPEDVTTESKKAYRQRFRLRLEWQWPAEHMRYLGAIQAELQQRQNAIADHILDAIDAEGDLRVRVELPTDRRVMPRLGSLVIEFGVSVSGSIRKARP